MRGCRDSVEGWQGRGEQLPTGFSPFQTRKQPEQQGHQRAGVVNEEAAQGQVEMTSMSQTHRRVH